ncbi:hypothetical protein BDR06DRAFT_970883 [Suillus hirtellus]|nr:hypothetical protein BDR06DRAFT_970883 [Suillus hirtellus]
MADFCSQHYLLAGSENVSPNNVVTEFADLEESKKTEELKYIEMLEGDAFDFEELDQVKQEIIPQAILDEVKVVNYNGKDDRRDDTTAYSLEFCLFCSVYGLFGDKCTKDKDCCTTKESLYCINSCWLRRPVNLHIVTYCSLLIEKWILAMPQSG